MFKVIFGGLGLLAITSFYGCASIVNGTNQPITVETWLQGKSISGAACKLENDKGSWYVTTPGSVTVHRSSEDLKLNCEKDTVPSGNTAVKSLTKGMAFGNILFGGLIGVGVDVASGAAFDYPTLVRVEMGEATAALLPSPSPVVTASSPANELAAIVQPSTAPQVDSLQGFPRRLLNRDMKAHFSRAKSLEVAKPRPFTLEIDSNGRIGRDCPTCNLQQDSGSMEIKEAESLVCFKWVRATYPADGCYQLIQLGQNEFSITSSTGRETYLYMVSR